MVESILKICTQVEVLLFYKNIIHLQVKLLVLEKYLSKNTLHSIRIKAVMYQYWY